MKNFARSIPEEKHRRERFVTGHEEVFDAAPDSRSDEHEQVASVRREREVVRVAPDPDAPHQLSRLGVDHPEVAALVVHDPCGPAVGVEDDAVRLAPAERDRADDLERVGVDDRHRLRLGVGDEERRRRGGHGGAQHGGQHQRHDPSRHVRPPHLAFSIAVIATFGGTPRTVKRTASPTRTDS